MDPSNSRVMTNGRHRDTKAIGKPLGNSILAPSRRPPFTSNRTTLQYGHIFLPFLSSQERRAATSAKDDKIGIDKDPSGNCQSRFPTSTADNEKEALMSELQNGYHKLISSSSRRSYLAEPDIRK